MRNSLLPSYWAVTRRRRRAPTWRWCGHDSSTLPQPFASWGQSCNQTKQTLYTRQLTWCRFRASFRVNLLPQLPLHIYGLITTRLRHQREPEAGSRFITCSLVI
jgi:hypothetical protein